MRLSFSTVPYVRSQLIKIIEKQFLIKTAETHCRSTRDDLFGQAARSFSTERIARVGPAEHCEAFYQKFNTNANFLRYSLPSFLPSTLFSHNEGRGSIILRETRSYRRRCARDKSARAHCAPCHTYTIFRSRKVQLFLHRPLAHINIYMLHILSHIRTYTVRETERKDKNNLQISGLCGVVARTGNGYKREKWKCVCDNLSSLPGMSKGYESKGAGLLYERSHGRLMHYCRIVHGRSEKMDR